MVFHLLADPEHWRKARASYMQGARGCKATLTNPNGYWRYDPQDPRVKKAVDFWLHRARNAHAFALGRKPVIPNFVCIDGGFVYQGPLYATSK